MALPTSETHPHPEPYTDFIEEIGLVMEQRGLPRIAGRIFALLLVTPGQLALDEIAGRLAVSRASVSTDARLLQRLGMLERASNPGDRKDYYRIASDYHLRSLQQALEAIGEMNRVLERTIAVPPDDPVIEGRLREFLAVHQDISATLSEKLEQWRAGAARRIA